jgi:hypothetical protein
LEERKSWHLYVQDEIIHFPRVFAFTENDGVKEVIEKWLKLRENFP